MSVALSTRGRICRQHGAAALASQGRICQRLALVIVLAGPPFAGVGFQPLNDAIGFRPIDDAVRVAADPGGALAEVSGDTEIFLISIDGYPP